MLNIIERMDPDRTTLILKGRIDLSAGKTFQAAIQQAQCTGNTHLVLNLDQVSYIDSVGFGWLMVAHHEFQNRQHALTLVVPPGPLLSVIKLVELDQLMTIVPREKDVPAPSTAFSL